MDTYKRIMLAKKKGTKYLRLLVVETNEPTIKLYLKNGFKQVNGINKKNRWYYINRIRIWNRNIVKKKYWLEFEHKNYANF